MQPSRVCATFAHIVFRLSGSAFFEQYPGHLSVTSLGDEMQRSHPILRRDGMNTA